MSDSVAFKVHLTDNQLFDTLPSNCVYSSFEEADILITCDANAAKASSAYKIYVYDSKPLNFENNISSNFDAWVIKNNIVALSALIRTNCKPKRCEITLNNNILTKLLIFDKITASNCEMIKEQLRHNVVAIRDIFQEQVLVMKNIHQEIKETKYDLQTARDTPDMLQRISILDSSIAAADDILHRADSVIEAMYGFVGILQFEDRLTQLLDGMKNALNECVGSINELDIKVDEGQEKALKELLVSLYTVQEQRDFALGLDAKPRYYNAPSIEDDAALFFD